MEPLYIVEKKEGVLLKVHIAPGAAANIVAGRFGDAVKISVKARAVEGAANKALVEVLADILGLKRRQVEIVRGHTSRDKIVQIEGISASQLMKALGIAPKDV